MVIAEKNTSSSLAVETEKQAPAKVEEKSAVNQTAMTSVNQTSNSTTLAQTNQTSESNATSDGGEADQEEDSDYHKSMLDMMELKKQSFRFRNF